MGCITHNVLKAGSHNFENEAPDTGAST